MNEIYKISLNDGETILYIMCCEWETDDNYITLFDDKGETVAMFNIADFDYIVRKGAIMT